MRAYGRRETSVLFPESELPSFVDVKDAYDRIVVHATEERRVGRMTYAEAMDMLERIKTGLENIGYSQATRIELIDFSRGEGWCCFCDERCNPLSQCCGKCARHMGIGPTKSVVENIRLMGRGSRGSTYTGTIDGSRRVIVQVVMGDPMLLAGIVGTPQFVQYDAPGFAECTDEQTVVVSLVPSGEYLKPGRYEDARAMLSKLLRVFKAMDERDLAMVEFDEKSVIATADGKLCLVDIGCTVRRKTEEMDDEYDQPPDPVFDYDQNTVWRIGKLVSVYEDIEGTPLALDLLQHIFVPHEIRMTLDQLFDHPYFE